MKNMKTLLALAAVLAMAGTAFADWSITVSQNPSPAPGLASYKVHTTGLNAFQELSITDVHQSNAVNWGAVVPTTFLSDFQTGAPAVLSDIDTHLLLIRDDILSSGTSDSETNDESDPSNSVDAGWVPWQGGLGDFSVAGAFTMKGLDCMSGMDLMQVVIPAGTTVYLFGKITSPEMTMYDLAEQGGIEIGGPVPEPGTMLMVLAGILCLMGVRSRKQLI
ncbi:MAG: PEP-CTERM sorting domain-containing protein [Pirellulales bacterium]|nr:PEP-CTERM sorting domain-containing protein [Pirellulales bacterium]